MSQSTGVVNQLVTFATMLHISKQYIFITVALSFFSGVFQLPDTFKDFVAKHTGSNGVNPKLMTHCHREMMHAQWAILLDDEFIEAYTHGIVIECPDGITRQFYPWLFTYSAGYPEK